MAKQQENPKFMIVFNPNALDSFTIYEAHFNFLEGDQIEFPVFDFKAEAFQKISRSNFSNFEPMMGLRTLVLSDMYLESIQTAYEKEYSKYRSLSRKSNQFICKKRRPTIRASAQIISGEPLVRITTKIPNIEVFPDEYSANHFDESTTITFILPPKGEPIKVGNAWYFEVILQREIIVQMFPSTKLEEALFDHLLLAPLQEQKSFFKNAEIDFDSKIVSAAATIESAEEEKRLFIHAKMKVSQFLHLVAIYNLKSTRLVRTDYVLNRDLPKGIQKHLAHGCGPSTY